MYIMEQGAFLIYIYLCYYKCCWEVWQQKIKCTFGYLNRVISANDSRLNKFMELDAFLGSQIINQ